MLFAAKCAGITTAKGFMSIRNTLMCACVIVGSTIIPVIAHADADIIVNTARPAQSGNDAGSAARLYVGMSYWKWEK